jgi:hypothetical protein
LANGTLAQTPPPLLLKVEWLGGSDLRQGPLIWRGGPPPLDISMVVNEGQVSGSEKSEISEWDEWKWHGVDAVI